MRDRTKRWLPWLALVLVVLGSLNFMWLFAETSTVGDASRGFVRDGRYYLVRGTVATEVSHEQWDWSRLHSTTLLLTHPLAMAGGAYLLFTVVFPSMLGAGDPVARRERIERIRRSGAPSASTRTGGKIGDLRATKPLVRVDVHPGGAIITVIGIQPLGIETGSLISVDQERYFGTSALRITHRQADTAADIRLYLDATSPVAQALGGLIPEQRADGRATEIAQTGSQASSSAPYPALMKAGIVVGIVLSVVFVTIALPFGRQLGGFGLVWSIVLVIIVGYNVWNYVIRNRHRW